MIRIVKLLSDRGLAYYSKATTAVVAPSSLIYCQPMQVRFWPRSIALIVLFALPLAPWLLIARAASPPSPEISANSSRLVLPPRPLPIYTDLDDDHTLDKAELLSSGVRKIIDVSFGNARRSQLYFDSESPDRGELLSADINHDKHPDLIWVPEDKSQKTVVWLGDGQGNFAVAKDTASSGPGANALLGWDGESGSRVGQGNSSPSRALITPVSKDLALGSTGKYETGAQTQLYSTTADSCHELSIHLNLLHERGPPTSLS